MARRHRHQEELVVRRNAGERSCDMNVTPLIDVLLVLLVIFMATLPLTQKGVDVNLPLEVNRVTLPKPDVAQIIVELSGARQLTINKQAISLADLQPRLRDLLEERTDKAVFIVGDRRLRYGDVMPLIDAGIGAGGRVAIVTDEMRAEAARRGG